MSGPEGTTGNGWSRCPVFPNSGLSGSGTPPLLRLLALAWWFLLCVAPVNTGMVGYADILGPLVIIALVLGCMHLAEKRASRQTKG